MIDFSRLRMNSNQKTINPRDIFMSLSRKNAKYQYPRDVQGEVWKQWFEQRNNKDTIIKMNTGSGKTVVALMILQSCLNEDAGPAIYVVPDKYLVKQVMQQADELGIKVVDSETDLDYQRKKAILITNIQKLVNGKSVFGLREENNYTIGSIIIDDIHACVGTIQEQFTVAISKENAMYNSITGLFYDVMNMQAEGRFADIIDGRNVFDNMLVPFWSWQDKSREVYEILSKNSETECLQFKWNLIKDSLKLSHCYISAKGISIVPNCTPMHKIKSFDDAKRRIYMSATLSDDSPFMTVMGIKLKKDMHVISPEKANDIGERLIIVPKIINKELREVEIKNALIQKAQSHNVIVLVPSFMMARYWKEQGGVVLSTGNISRGIEDIKSKNNGLYVIVNRYDGIDLPDDACRILVIDGLPNISNMDDKYEQEIVRKSERIQREQIQRIEQGMGRGVRSHNDYCLVYLLGNQLTTVLYADEGYKYFSRATKAQFELSEKICEQIEGQGLDAIIEIGDYVLDRDPMWIETCKNATSEIDYAQEICITKSAMALRKAFDYGSYGDYERSEKIINDLVNEEDNSRVRGYYKQILAEYVNFTDKNKAQQILKSAKRENIDILNPIEGIQFIKEKNSLPEQSRNIIDRINSLEYDENDLILYLDSVMDDLRFVENSSKRFENAIKDIFVLIGYGARQPEREVGKGPDDFVILGAGDYFVIECKNETTTDTISKHDCNQLNGSYTWFNNLYKDEQVRCTPIMIHNSNVFNYECSPNETIRIMTPELLSKFKKNIRAFVIAMCKNKNFKNIEKINRLIKEHLLYKEALVKEYTISFSVKTR